jgi:hypothetical protein
MGQRTLLIAMLTSLTLLPLALSDERTECEPQALLEFEGDLRLAVDPGGELRVYAPVSAESCDTARSSGHRAA